MKEAAYKESLRRKILESLDSMSDLTELQRVYSVRHGVSEFIFWDYVQKACMQQIIKIEEFNDTGKRNGFYSSLAFKLDDLIKIRDEAKLMRNIHSGRPVN